MVQNLDFQGYSDRLPPQNVDAEEAILGGILLDPEAIGRVMEILNADAFYISAHKTLYRAAMDLHSRGLPTDLMTVTNWLKDRELLEKVGGTSRIAQLVDRTLSAANIDQYATLVMEKYMRRRLIQIGGEISQLGFEAEQPLELSLDEAEQKLFGITQDRPQQALTSTADILIETFAEIEERAEGIVLPGVPCGFYDLDAMTQGFQRSDLIIAAGRPSMGKCLSADAEILLADGSLKTIGEIYQEQTAELLTLGTDWRFRSTCPSAYVDDGIKPVYRVRTSTGRIIETTLSHPYLTIAGWRPLAELQVGEKIAVPRTLPVFGTETLPAHQVKILAYLIGDGCLTQTAPQFTNENPILQVDFTQAALQFPGVRVEVEDLGDRQPSALRVTADPVTASQNAMVLWLRELGLWGQSAHVRTIPAPVFSLKKPQLALFLNRLFAANGWATVMIRDQVQLGFATVSEKAARQIQHLLLRFGVVARLSPSVVEHQNSRHAAWQLDITDVSSIKVFLAEIGMLGKEAALEAIAEAVSHMPFPSHQDPIPVEIWDRIQAVKGAESWASLVTRAGIQQTSVPAVYRPTMERDRLFALATALEDAELQAIATSEVYWDEIVEITPVGEKQVYDLTIPETHNFVANDICVHNTAFVLNIARNIASTQKLPVAIFSLEMSKQQLVYRLLSSELALETSRLRTGRLNPNEWTILGQGINQLSEMPIFIDDTPNISVNEMRSKARRLQAEQGGALGLVLIDYLQLMEGSSDNRVQELSKITRSLKGLARELNVPIISLSQLSRGVESRTNKRPMMSDLRECVTGDTLVWLADGRRLPIAELVGQMPEVISMNERGCLIKAQADCIWEVGTKPVFELTTVSGRKIKATGKHRLYTLNGWRQLQNLRAGDRLAVANHMPMMGQPSERWPDLHVILLAHLIGDGSYITHQPLRYTTASEDNSAIVKAAAESFGCTVNRHAGKGNWHQLVISGNGDRWHPAGVGLWLKELGIFNQRSAEKRVPAAIFQLPNDQIALFLQHLWATDGCISSYHHPNGKKYKASIFFSTVSETLARDVVALLARLGIAATMQWTKAQCYTVQIYGKTQQLKFLEVVGAFGPRVEPAKAAEVELLRRGKANPNRDTIPIEVFDLVKTEMKAQGVSQRRMAAIRGTSYGGTSHFKFAPTREVLLSYADILGSPELKDIATSDLYWDEIAEIKPLGEATVYDLTVPGPASWMSDGIVSHNSGSIEQDADVIMMLYREEYYDPDTPDRGIAEIIITKHRNGPTGTVKLLFEPQYTRFRNLAQPPG
jgi:replicative DNA helicase